MAQSTPTNSYCPRASFGCAYMHHIEKYVFQQEINGGSRIGTAFEVLLSIDLAKAPGCLCCSGLLSAAWRAHTGACQLPILT